MHQDVPVHSPIALRVFRGDRNVSQPFLKLRRQHHPLEGIALLGHQALEALNGMSQRFDGGEARRLAHEGWLAEARLDVARCHAGRALGCVDTEGEEREATSSGEDLVPVGDKGRSPRAQY